MALPHQCSPRVQVLAPVNAALLRAKAAGATSHIPVRVVTRGTGTRVMLRFCSEEPRESIPFGTDSWVPDWFSQPSFLIDV